MPTIVVQVELIYGDRVRYVVERYVSGKWVRVKTIDVDRSSSKRKLVLEKEERVVVESMEQMGIVFDKSQMAAVRVPLPAVRPQRFEQEEPPVLDVSE